MTNDARYWVLIPAAGVGRRMEADMPKQYIKVEDKTIIEHTLSCFLQREEIERIVVAIADKDDYWPALPISKDNKVITAPGGKERYQSVLNGLQVLSEMAEEHDWVLVHDAARPCLQQSVIDRLMIELRTHETGGILALPCRDTMKRADVNNEITATVERENLWHAQTPQMFRYGKLVSALEKVLCEGTLVTDEAMAMELSGYKPKLVLGQSENIKLTHKDDLESVKNYLKR